MTQTALLKPLLHSGVSVLQFYVLLPIFFSARFFIPFAFSFVYFLLSLVISFVLPSSLSSSHCLYVAPLYCSLIIITSLPLCFRSFVFFLSPISFRSLLFRVLHSALFPSLSFYLSSSLFRHFPVSVGLFVFSVFPLSLSPCFILFLSHTSTLTLFVSPSPCHSLSFGLSLPSLLLFSPLLLLPPPYHILSVTFPCSIFFCFCPYL